MSDADQVRLERIAGKLGVETHGFELGPPLPEDVVADFERRHDVVLPSAYRLFVTELGNGSAGPGPGLSRLASCCGHRRSGHLAQPSPYLPGPRYLGDWEQRYEAPPSQDRIFMPGTLEVASHGCSLVTRLIVTGPARGRLINLDYEGPIGPYVVEDADFLAWCERWLDEAAAGYDVGWFGEGLPLDEPELVAVLDGDPSPARRARAGSSLLSLPMVSDSAWSALVGAVTTDGDAAVRASLWDLLKWRRHKHERRLDDVEPMADDIARHARSCTPPDLDALDVLRRLTLADVLPELASTDLERCRRAAFGLTQLAWATEESPRPEALDDVVGGLLRAADPILRSHGVVAVDRFGLTRLHPVLRELLETETDPWVRYHLGWCLSE